MLRKRVASGLFALALALTGGTLISGAPVAAATTAEVTTVEVTTAEVTTAEVTTAEAETRQFVGEGSSSWGFSLDYARAQARSRANAAGYPNCTEIYVEDWFYYAKVIWECTP